MTPGLGRINYRRQNLNTKSKIAVAASTIGLLLVLGAALPDHQSSRLELVPLRVGFGSETRDTAIRWNPVTGQAWVYLEAPVHGMQQFAWLPIMETFGHVPNVANTAPLLNTSQPATQDP